MQIRFALQYALRRGEFVGRALLFSPILQQDLEPHLLSEEGREALAQCNPDLPEIFDLLMPVVDGGADADSRNLWELKLNPNAYTAAEICEMWVRDFVAARDAPPEAAPAASEAPKENSDA